MKHAAHNLLPYIFDNIQSKEELRNNNLSNNNNNNNERRYPEV